MQYQIKNTRDVTNNGIKINIAGRTGIGKTRSISTLKRPLVISSENGLLSLRDMDIPYIEVNDINSFKGIKSYITSPEVWGLYDTLVIDSVTDIAERILFNTKKMTSNKMKAYGDMIEIIYETLIDILSIQGKDIVSIYHLGRVEDGESGSVSYMASTPSDKLANKMPFLFDEVFVLRWLPWEDGKEYKVFQTFNDGKYDAKDRSGSLDQYEPYDLGAIIEKIKNSTNTNTGVTT